MGSALLICLILLAGMGYALLKSHQDLVRARAEAQGAVQALRAAQVRIQELETDQQAALRDAAEQRNRALEAESEAYRLRDRMERTARELVGPEPLPTDAASVCSWLAEVAQRLTWNPA